MKKQYIIVQIRGKIVLYRRFGHEKNFDYRKNDK